MRCLAGEKMMALAAAFAAEISCGTDANEILAFSDFFGMVTANLIAIANRKLYMQDENNDCCNKPPKKNLQKTPKKET
jgi:hypothetical protein